MLRKPFRKQNERMKIMEIEKVGKLDDLMRK